MSSLTPFDPDKASGRSDWAPGFTVVGIGASAGGLAALQQLLRGTPADSGMAYVIVVHLSPEHPSALADILQRETEMSVRQVTEDVELIANCVYVIPPNRNLASIDSHLRLEPLEEQRRDRAPIDHFFRTLSNTHQHKAVGIILSGTGSDGTIGLGYIRERGGICIAQDPAQAEHSAMPQSAIAHGVVDRVLLLDKMPENLLQIRDIQAQIRLPDDVAEVSAAAQRMLQKILAQIRVQCGHDFTRYKPSTIVRRIRRRMQLRYIQDLEAYLQILRAEPDEVRDLADDMLITVTNFFRDRSVFDHLEREVVPQLFEKLDRDNNKIRLWSVGCATGEEAYSLAILLLEACSELDVRPEIQIFASDLHHEALNRAREGFYSESIEGDVPPERLRRFFIKERGGYQVRKEVRELIIFAPHNLLRDPPFSKLDLITCRNLLIYLQRDVQQDIIELFHYALKPDGHLLLGASESVDNVELFRCADKEHKVFVRRNNCTIEPRMPITNFEHRQERPVAPSRVPEASYSYGNLHQRMVELFGPPSVLINHDHNIVHYSARAGQFMIQPGGAPTNNIFKRVRDEMRVELRSAIYAVEQGAATTSSKPIELHDGIKGTRRIVIRVESSGEAEMEGYLLVFFDEVKGDHPAVFPTTQGNGSENSRELASELELTQRRLQMVIEEYETTQEEMRASNEELQSANEELRSTLEELETSKEELQSMNEELVTVNQENRHKVEELSTLTNDLQNLFASTEIATLFLDRQLRILRYTPQVGQLFSVRPTDRGRPLGDFTHRLGYDRVEGDAREVLRTLQPIQREVQDEQKNWYLMRILPYRSAEDRIEGVVITLVEISQQKETEERLRASEQDLRQLTSTLEDRIEQATQTVRQLASNLALAEQQERTRIAHILHDDLQQMLASVQMRFHILQLKHQLPEEEADELTRDLQLTIDMTRNLTIDLSPPILDTEGFPEVLRWLAARMREEHNLTVQLKPHPEFPALQREVQVLLFQIVRELLFNVVKHAQTHEAKVTLFTTDYHLQILISDDGDGFDPGQSQEKPSGFGLSSVQERLQLFGGTLDIQSRPGDGCRITVQLPLEAST